MRGRRIWAALDGFACGCHIEDDREAYLCWLVFETLIAAALDPSGSRMFLQAVPNRSALRGDPQ
jgi:hypothetical protein